MPCKQTSSTSLSPTWSRIQRAHFTNIKRIYYALNANWTLFVSLQIRICCPSFELRNKWRGGGRAMCSACKCTHFPGIRMEISFESAYNVHSLFMSQLPGWITNSRAHLIRFCPKFSSPWIPFQSYKFRNHIKEFKFIDFFSLSSSFFFVWIPTRESTGATSTLHELLAGVGPSVGRGQQHQQPQQQQQQQLGRHQFGSLHTSGSAQQPHVSGGVSNSSQADNSVTATNSNWLADLSVEVCKVDDDEEEEEEEEEEEGAEEESGGHEADDWDESVFFEAVTAGHSSTTQHHHRQDGAGHLDVLLGNPNFHNTSEEKISLLFFSFTSECKQDEDSRRLATSLKFF